MLFPGLYDIPGGVSAAMSMKPLPVSSMLCMILFASSPPAVAPKSPKVFTVRVPPKTSL